MGPERGNICNESCGQIFRMKHRNNCFDQLDMRNNFILWLDKIKAEGLLLSPICCVGTWLAICIECVTLDRNMNKFKAQSVEEVLQKVE